MTPDERRRRLIGRLILTGVLVAGAAGGLLAVRAGKRLAQQRKARVGSAGTTAPPR
jgi:hypothetical protein